MLGSALLLGLVLTGCKSGSSAPADPAVSAVPAAPAPARVDRDGQPVIACFGDSLTAGFGADDGQSYPDFLQKDLDQDGYRYRVVNEGVSGNTTKDGIDRLPQVLALKPAVVVLEFGGNDGLRGFKTEATRANLATMIEALQRAGIKVILAGITLPPDYGPDYVQAFTGNYAALAKRYKLPLLPFILKDVYGVAGLMQADNIHATNRGNAVVARNVLPFVEPLLRKD
jgi:acyl-CoA thioesterase-1